MLPKLLGVQMKYILPIFSLLLGVNSFADCIDISGIYRIGPNSFEKYIQHSCQKLEVFYGKQEESGSIDWGNRSNIFSLTEQRHCTVIQTCSTGKANAQELKVFLEKAHIHSDPEHGVCSFTASMYSRKQETVIKILNLYDCDDGFSGERAIELLPVN